MVDLVLVDDHQIVLDSLKILIESVADFKVIAVANNGEQALQLLPHVQPQLVLMDVHMPGMNGVEVTEKIKQHHPNLKVMMLTMSGDPLIIKQAIDAGADGYMLKSTGKEELEHGIRAVCKGKTFYSREVAQILINDHLKASTDARKVLSVLTAREREVMQLICNELSVVEIAALLGLSEHTVKTHRKNILHKLKLKNTAALVTLAFQLSAK